MTDLKHPTNNLNRFVNRDMSVDSQTEYGEVPFKSPLRVVGAWRPSERPLPDTRDMNGDMMPVVGKLCAFMALDSAVVPGFRQGPDQVERGSMLVFVDGDPRDPASWAHYPPGGSQFVAVLVD